MAYFPLRSVNARLWVCKHKHLPLLHPWPKRWPLDRTCGLMTVGVKCVCVHVCVCVRRRNRARKGQYVSISWCVSASVCVCVCACVWLQADAGWFLALSFCLPHTLWCGLRLRLSLWRGIATAHTHTVLTCLWKHTLRTGMQSHSQKCRHTYRANAPAYAHMRAARPLNDVTKRRRACQSVWMDTGAHS